MNYTSRIPATIMAVLRTKTRRGFLICALSLCSLAIVASAWKANTNQPIALAVLDTFSQVAPNHGFDVSFEGVFPAILGPDVITGTSTMDVNVAGDIARCKFTWVPSGGNGTLVLASVCVLSQGHGTWHVEEGRTL